jgi:hypothetical protein
MFVSSGLVQTLNYIQKGEKKHGPDLQGLQFTPNLPLIEEERRHEP